MSAKGSLGNVFLFHTYMVRARMKVKFGKVLSPTKFIQKVIYDRNGKLVLHGMFVEGTKIKTHVPSAFLLECLPRDGVLLVGLFGMLELRKVEPNKDDYKIVALTGASYG